MAHPVDFIFENAHGDKWLKEMILVSAKENTACMSCGRLSQDWRVPYHGAMKDKKVHCTSCQMLMESSLELLGVNAVKPNPRNIKKLPPDIQKKVKGFPLTDPYLGQSGYGLDCRPLPIDGEEEVECSECNKTSSGWLNPHRGFKIKIDGRTRVVCIGCHSKFEDRIRLIDNPFVSGRGYPDGGKIVMMLGCAMLVTLNGTIFGTNHTITEDPNDSETEPKESGFFPRFNISPNCPYELIPLTESRFLSYLSENPPEPPFILIDKFCQTYGNLIRNLRITRDLKSTYLCSHEGIRKINLLDVSKVVSVAEQMPKAQFKKHKYMLGKVLTGRAQLDDNEITSSFEKNPLAKKLYEQLSINPWESKDLLDIAEKSYV